MKRILFLSLLLVLASCSKYSRIVKSKDKTLKYEAAVKYYEKEDYFKAMPLFEELLDEYRGTAEAEKMYYYYSKCQFGLGDFMLAGYHFKNFVETFPSSKYREECFYLYAYCDYKESLPYYLDQEKTLDAINNFQLFINLFPGSKYVSECNILMDELRAKLHEKVYSAARLYYQIGDYKAAVVACRNAVKDYPDIAYKEELDYMIVKSAYLYAKNSFENKQEERFMDALESYREFALQYPNSKYMKELLVIEKHSKEALKTIAEKPKQVN